MVMKKSPIAVPGALRAMETVPSTWRSPVLLVGSCLIASNARRALWSIPPWISPLVGVWRLRAAR